MPYTASRQSLYGQVGAPNAPTGGVDVAGAIDALGGGAASLIHAAMLRRQNEQATALAADERAYQRERDTVEDKRRAADEDRKDQEFALRKTQDEREFMLKGGVPAHDEMTPVPTQSSVAMPVAPAQPVSPIRRVMTRGLPAPSYMPAAPQPAPAARAPLPATTLQNTTVPEHIDPTKSVSYQQATDVATIRGQVEAENAARRAAEQSNLQATRIQAAKDAAVAAQAGRVELEKLRQKGRQSTIHRGMTINAESKLAETTADGLISSFNGDREGAFEWLNGDDPEAVKLRGMDLPISWGTYLDNARSRWTKAATGQALTFQHGAMGDAPAEAAKKVQDTRAAVAPPRIGRGAATPAAPKVPAGAESLTPSAGSPFRVGAPTAPKVPAAPKNTAPKDDFTDDEVNAALDAGKDNEADIRKYILDQRKKTPPKKKG